MHRHHLVAPCPNTEDRVLNSRLGTRTARGTKTSQALVRHFIPGMSERLRADAAKPFVIGEQYEFLTEYSYLQLVDLLGLAVLRGAAIAPIIYLHRNTGLALPDGCTSVFSTKRRRIRYRRGQPDEQALIGGVGASIGTQDHLRSQATEESSDMPFPFTQPRTKTALVDSASELADPGESNEEEGGVPGGDQKGTDPDAEGETDDEDGDELAAQVGAPAAQKRASKDVKNLMDVDGEQSQDQPPAPSGQGQFAGEESGGNAGETGKEDTVLKDGKNAGYTNEGMQGSRRYAMDVDLLSATGAGKGASVKTMAAQGEPPRPVRRAPGTGPRSVRTPNKLSPTVATVGAEPALTGANISTPGAVTSGASANVPPGTDQAVLDDVSSIKPVKKSKPSKKNKKKRDKEDSNNEESANDEFSKLWYIAQLGYPTAGYDGVLGAGMGISPSDIGKRRRAARALRRAGARGCPVAGEINYALLVNICALTLEFEEQT
ncbi:hypothetical protein EV715DRAFT_266593 [Schizophyllum commune]